MEQTKLGAFLVSKRVTIHQLVVDAKHRLVDELENGSIPEESKSIYVNAIAVWTKFQKDLELLMNDEFYEQEMKRGE